MSDVARNKHPIRYFSSPGCLGGSHVDKTARPTLVLLMAFPLLGCPFIPVEATSHHPGPGAEVPSRARGAVNTYDL